MPTTEPVLNDDTSRFVLFPIRYSTLWDKYKKSQKSFWTTEEIDFSGDVADWTHALTSDERRLLSVILAFFASSDGIVAENLVERFCAEVRIPEARCFYGFQLMMENIHAETYARVLQELISDERELLGLFKAIDTIPSVADKANWCLKWFDREMYSFTTRLIAFAIVEGVFFSSSFAAIFWVKSRGLLPGLCHSNELIMRDEGQHVEFACDLYRTLHGAVAVDVVYDMMGDAVELEKSFFVSALPTPLRGLNATLMGQYVEYVADFLLTLLGFPSMYNQTNPFPFMESTAIPGRASFFDRSVSDYLGAAVGTSPYECDGDF